MTDLGMKRCSKCKSLKVLTDFNKSKSTASGYSSWCKSCWSLHHKSKTTAKVCPHCDTLFFRKNSQVYCSLKCAVWSRVPIGGVDECWLWQGALVQGYGCFTFNHVAYRTTRAIFLLDGLLDTSLDVLHSCDNPTCCNPKHLRLGTAKENSVDKYLRNRYTNPKLDKHYRATLTNTQVLEIKALLGVVKQVDIAKLYNVKRSVIADISVGRSWKGL